MKDLQLNAELEAARAEVAYLKSQASEACDEMRQYLAAIEEAKEELYRLRAASAEVADELRQLLAAATV